MSVFCISSSTTRTRRRVHRDCVTRLHAPSFGSLPGFDPTDRIPKKILMEHARQFYRSRAMADWRDVQATHVHYSNDLWPFQGRGRCHKRPVRTAASGHKSLKLVIFDCDGTLVDSQHVICAAMQQAYEANSLSVP